MSSETDELILPVNEDEDKRRRRKKKPLPWFCIFLLCCCCCVVVLLVVGVSLGVGLSGTTTTTTSPLATTTPPTTTTPSPVTTSPPVSPTPSSTTGAPTTPAPTPAPPTPAAPTPSPTSVPCPGAYEKCNNTIDDDCDGQIDELDCIACNETCSLNVGQCTQGVWSCQNPLQYICVNGTLPVTEICCNELDDDCDGVIDNGCICTTVAPTPAPTPGPPCCGSSQCLGGDCIGDAPGHCTFQPLLECCDIIDCPLTYFCNRLGQCKNTSAVSENPFGLCINDDQCRTSGDTPLFNVTHGVEWSCVYPSFPATGVCVFRNDAFGFYVQPNFGASGIAFCNDDSACPTAPIGHTAICADEYFPGGNNYYVCNGFETMPWNMIDRSSFSSCYPEGDIPAQCPTPPDNFCTNIILGNCGPPTPSPPPQVPPPKCNATLCAGSGNLACCPTLLQADCCSSAPLLGLCDPDPSGTFIVGNSDGQSACLGFCPYVLGGTSNCGGCGNACSSPTPYCCPNGPLNTYGNTFRCSAVAPVMCSTNFADCYCNGTCVQVTNSQNCGTCGNVCPDFMPFCCTTLEGTPFCSVESQCLDGMLFFNGTFGFSLVAHPELAEIPEIASMSAQIRLDFQEQRKKK